MIGTWYLLTFFSVSDMKNPLDINKPITSKLEARNIGKISKIMKLLCVLHVIHKAVNFVIVKMFRQTLKHTVN